MTLQQLRYITAIDSYRSFARAAEELGISQPTLSTLLQKLENELDVRIFDRSNKHVTPTAIGEKIIRQARLTLNEANRISELVNEEKCEVSGKFNLSVGPSIAPSLGQDDTGVSISGHIREGIMEIPLYTEPFWVYIAESCWRKLPVFKPEDLEHENMWIMKESQCLRESAFSFCKSRSTGKRIYEAGSIDTLIRIVDANGGYTIIPEMHLPMLTDRQRGNVRRIDGDFLSQRKVSLYIRHDFIRQQLINSMLKALTTFIPANMLDTRLLKYGIKL